MEKFILGNSGYDPTIRTENDRIPARFGHLNKIVDAINGISNRFDVTFPASEFRNIATTPLVVVESNRSVIITSANAILFDQTEEFNFDVAVGIITGATQLQLIEVGYEGVDSYFNGVNGSFGFFSTVQQDTIGTGNAYIYTKGSDATTGDGFVRIIGTYYEIDL